ncbi:O-antigen ligase family protein [Mesorhizobium shangrilense]|uniref:O-antigen ligase n=1 Tax=Mesorhizobium shangrilense TaxID=460060 RepID=A0ABV2DCK0_9HYPH
MSRLSSIKEQFTPSLVNIYFSIVCFLSPVVGSAVSFVFNGGALWSVLLIAMKRRRFNADRPMLAMTAAVYAYCGANLLASIINNSIVRDAPHLLSLVTFLFFPISYSTWSISRKTTLVRIIIVSSICACLGALVLAIIQQYWLGIRAKGGAGNAIVFAEVACLSVMICLTCIVSGIEKLRGVVLICAVLAGSVAIIYSGSRIIWLALLMAGIAVFLINLQTLKGKNAVRLLLLLTAVAVVSAVLGFRVIIDRADFLFTDWNSLATHGDYTTALGLRVALWDIGLRAFREAPLFGHGMGAATPLMLQGFQERYGMAEGFSHFHNGFLTALVEAGILGAVTLAAIFVVAARNAAKVLRASIDPIERFGATMIVIVVITYLTAGMTGILVGHDILDSVLMIFLVSGTYLASGRTIALPETRMLPTASATP